MIERVELELTRVRRMAEQASDSMLVYLIDMAILKANAKARAASDALANEERFESARDIRLKLAAEE